MIKILLVDDHQVVRGSLCKLLSEIKHFAVVGEASNGEEAWELVTCYELNVDVVLMDIQMPGMGGFEATRRFLRRYPRIKVIILTGCTNELYPYHLLHMGASGYLTKECGLTELVRAIDSVSSGQIYFSAKISEQLLLKKSLSPFYTLSPIEMQILLMLIKGQSLSKIAKKLYLSLETVGTYRYRILKKINAKNDIELIRLAASEGLLDSVNLI